MMPPSKDSLSPFGRRTLVTMANDVEVNEIDDIDDFDNSFDPVENSFGSRNRKVNPEDHAALGDDLDFLLNGGFEKISNESPAKLKSVSKSSKSKTKSKSRDSKSKSKSSSLRSRKSSSSKSSPTKEYSLSRSFESSQDLSEFGIEDISAKTETTEQSLPGDVVQTSMGFGSQGRSPSSIRGSRRIVVSKSLSQEDAGDAGDTKEDILTLTPPSSAIKHDKKKIINFDDTDVSSLMKPGIGIRLEEDDDELSIEDIPFVVADDDNSTPIVGMEQKTPLTSLSPHPRKQEESSSPPLMNNTPTISSGRGFDFGLSNEKKNDYNDNDQGDGGGEFDWMAPRIGRVGRGRSIKEKPKKEDDWMQFNTDRPKRAHDPFATTAPSTVKTFTFIDSDDSDEDDVDDAVSNSIWGGGMNKRKTLSSSNSQTSTKAATPVSSSVPTSSSEVLPAATTNSVSLGSRPARDDVSAKATSRLGVDEDAQSNAVNTKTDVQDKDTQQEISFDDSVEELPMTTLSPTTEPSAFSRPPTIEVKRNSPHSAVPPKVLTANSPASPGSEYSIEFEESSPHHSQRQEIMVKIESPSKTAIATKEEEEEIVPPVRNKVVVVGSSGEPAISSLPHQHEPSALNCSDSDTIEDIEELDLDQAPHVPSPAESTNLEPSPQPIVGPPPFQHEGASPQSRVQQVTVSPQSRVQQETVSPQQETVSPQSRVQQETFSPQSRVQQETFSPQSRVQQETFSPQSRVQQVTVSPSRVQQATVSEASPQVQHDCLQESQLRQSGSPENNPYSILPASDSGIKLDDIASIVKRSVEKAIGTVRNQSMIDIANTRAECEVQLAEARDQTEAVKKALQIEENKIKILQTRADVEKESALNQLAQDLNSRHKDDLRRLKDVHLKELAAKDRAGGSEAALRELTDEFHHSVGTLELIKHQMEAGKHGSHVTREAELDARERRIGEEMIALKNAEVANEKKVAEVRALLHNLAEMQRTMRSDAYVEKQRLADESERLTRESECRERAACAREASLGAERKQYEITANELREKYQKLDTENSNQRKEIELGFLKLDTAQKSFEELKLAALRELEEREVAIKEREQASKLVLEALQSDALELEHQTSNARAEIERAVILKHEAEEEMARATEERTRVRELGLRIEEASEKVARRATEAELKFQEASELMIGAEESEHRSAAHRVQVDGVVIDLEKQRLNIEQTRTELMHEQRSLREVQQQVEQRAREVLLSEVSAPAVVMKSIKQSSMQRRQLEMSSSTLHSTYFQGTSSLYGREEPRVPLSNRSNSMLEGGDGGACLSTEVRSNSKEFESLRKQESNRSKVIDSQVQFLRDIGAID